MAEYVNDKQVVLKEEKRVKKDKINEEEKVVADNLEFSLDELHTNLIIISKIPAHYKLNINGRTITIDNTYVQFATRWMYGDDRLKSIAFIKDIINQTFIKTNKIIKDPK